jgi:hypothetical protein
MKEPIKNHEQPKTVLNDSDATGHCFDPTLFGDWNFFILADVDRAEFRIQNSESRIRIRAVLRLWRRLRRFGLDAQAIF